MDSIEHISYKIERYNDYLQQLKEDSKPCLLAPEEISFLNNHISYWGKELEDQERMSAYIVDYMSNVYKPLLKVICRVLLHEATSFMSDFAKINKRVEKRATPRDIYRALYLCDEDVRFELLQLENNTWAEETIAQFNCGEESFIRFVTDKNLCLDQLSKWAKWVNTLETIINGVNTVEKPGSGDQLQFLFDHPSLFIHNYQDLSLTERTGLNILGKLFGKKINIWGIELILHLFITWYWEHLYSSFDESEDYIVMDIVCRKCKYFSSGSFEQTYYHWNVLKYGIPPEIGNNTPKESDSKKQQWTPIWQHDDYEDPKELMGMKDVLNGIFDKLEVVSDSKLEDSRILELFGDPRQYNYRDLDLFESTSPSLKDHDSYLGLRERLDNYMFVIFVNSLANIGYLENTEENLQRFVFRLTGRTLKDREQMKDSKAVVKLLSSPYGKGTNQTSKALWYIIQSICDTANNGGSRQKIESKGSVYEKSTKLFAFGTDEQRWFTNKKNYMQTVNHQRADDRIKVLLYLLFDVPIKNSNK